MTDPNARKEVVHWFGTLDEVLETLTLIQTPTIKQCPVILMGTNTNENTSDASNTMLTTSPKGRTNSPAGLQ